MPWLVILKIHHCHSTSPGVYSKLSSAVKAAKNAMGFRLLSSILKGMRDTSVTAAIPAAHST